MIRIEHTDVYGWEAAVRGARNPMNSWKKSDSYNTYVEDAETKETARYAFFLGENDLKLLHTLSKAGPDHGKFLRMINVTVDLTAPLYWWKEFDTYKVGTVANSCSTMHKIHAKPFTLDDFSTEHLRMMSLEMMDNIIKLLNVYRANYLDTKEKIYWWQLIQMLPSSYNQRRTVQFNYAVLKAMYHARKNHKLDEWHTFCEWVESLPYFKELIQDESDET